VQSFATARCVTDAVQYIKAKSGHTTMTYIHLVSGEQTSQQKRLVSIYWDYQNVYLSQELASLFLVFANSKGRLIGKKVYCNSLFDNQASAKENLQNIGFNCNDVTCSLKNSADNQLKSDLIDDAYNNNSPNIVILVSGDGDFINPVKFLQNSGKNVIIFAKRGNVKKSLKELANEFHFVDELPQLVGEKKQPQITSVKVQINYNEAIEYLIEAIKTGLSQGKRTVLSYIDNLMRQRFPNYQGASCILTPDGKKFSRFSKFVNAVVKEGKVRMQNQELLLIE
jgi:uncharacterized LabA/DUF88 family protein